MIRLDYWLFVVLMASNPGAQAWTAKTNTYQRHLHLISWIRGIASYSLETTECADKPVWATRWTVADVIAIHAAALSGDHNESVLTCWNDGDAEKCELTITHYGPGSNMSRLALETYTHRGNTQLSRCERRNTANIDPSKARALYVLAQLPAAPNCESGDPAWYGSAEYKAAPIESLIATLSGMEYGRNGVNVDCKDARCKVEAFHNDGEAGYLMQYEFHLDADYRIELKSLQCVAL